MSILPAEIEEGSNIEYKRRFDTFSESKLLKLRSQLLWRMSEGELISGIPEAIYYIGIDDDGTVSGIDLEKSLNKFEIFISKDIYVVSKQIFNTHEGDYAKYVLRPIINSDNKHVKIAFVGDSGGGKTSIISILTSGLPDDENSSAKKRMYRYAHERESGITSSINYSMIGFNNNNIINNTTGFLISPKSIVKQSDTIINLIDLPGNPKYVKTTLFGLTAHKPDYVFIILNGMNVDLSYNNVLPLIRVCEKLGIEIYYIITHSDKINEYNVFLASIIPPMVMLVGNYYYDCRCYRCY